MPFAASQKSVTAAVKTPAKRNSRFFQKMTSVDRLPRALGAQKGTRTSLNPMRSVGSLYDDVK